MKKMMKNMYILHYIYWYGSGSTLSKRNCWRRFVVLSDRLKDFFEESAIEENMLVAKTIYLFDIFDKLNFLNK